MEFGFDLGEDFAVFLGLFAGEFAVLAADGEVVLVFGCKHSVNPVLAS